MSLDRSLKSGSSLSQHRSVLTRAERISRMKGEGTFQAADGPLGLPKTLSPKLIVRKKVKKKVEEGAEGEAGAAAAPAAAPAAKGGAPAKAAAPAAKGGAKK